MARGRLKAVLALIVAMLFVFQAAPMYSFADEQTSQSVAQESNTSQDQSQKASDNQDGTLLNYAIDENGNKVELTDEMIEAAENESEPTATPSGIYKADTDSFYEYDKDEITLAGEDSKFNETFDECNVGDTEVPGWIFKATSISGKESKSEFSIVNDSTKGKVLRIDKKINGANNGSYDSGDENVFAVHDLKNPLTGKISVSADLKIELAGRLGLFFYGKTDSIENDISSASPTVPYMGKVLFWDTGLTSGNPLTNTPKGINYWSDGTKIEDKDIVTEANVWYNVSYDIDTEKGMYSVKIIDESGNKVYLRENIALSKTILDNSDGYIQGFGFTIGSETKALGTCVVKNLKVVDNNNAEQDAKDLAADMTALSLPDGVDADKIESDFVLPLSGDNGSSITWTSSNTDVLTIDNSTGAVKINRPEYSGDVSVKILLTANLENGSASASRDFNLKVLEKEPGTDKQKVDADTEILALPSTLKIAEVTDDFNVDIKGFWGSTVTYTSSNNNIASVDNTTGLVTITRPSFTGAGTQEITLTATVKYGNSTDTKIFTFNVKEEDPKTDQEKALYDAKNAKIGGIDITNVRQSSFYLDNKGSFSNLSWLSGNEEYIKIEKNLETNEDNEVIDLGGFKAVVTRPKRGKTAVTVTLTVTASIGGATETNDFTLTIVPEDELKAYPGVEGYGAYSRGGRGGQVYHVTTLAQDGEGSLTYGLEHVQGARTIVFDVGGVIDLTSLGRPINIKGEKYSNVTISGQTAPYPGITLKGYGLTVSSAHDVIIRNIKIRIGDVFETGAVNQSDPISIGSSKQVVVDHCSMQWAIDMDFRATGEYITISNTIFGKSLSANSPHEKGGHAYVGMINEGARKVTFAKNFVGDSTQRSPRITDADWIDSYNCLLYNCGNGYDLFNYEWQNKNAKMNVHNNLARMGPSVSNGAPFRAGRGREYAGGVMTYFDGNYTTNKGTSKLVPTCSIQQTNKVDQINKKLYFGKTNSNTGGIYDLSAVTLDEWNTNPASYDNNNKAYPGGTLTYMTYPFPAPRGDVMEVFEDGVLDTNHNNIIKYAVDDNGMGATKPGRDLYDTMILKEMKAGGNYGGSSNIYSLKVSMTEDEISPFFDALEVRTGQDFSEYKTARSWYVKQGEGPTLKGAKADVGFTKPVHWDDYTDVNTLTNPEAKEKYDEHYVTDFEVGDWWGQYCGSPGQETTYTLYDNKLNRVFKTTNPDYDQTRYSLQSVDTEYVATKRTVADLYPADWIKNNYPEIAEFMDNYRELNYEGKDLSYEIAWDGMYDGIPNWYKQYRGWSTSKYLASEIDKDTGYTYLEEYMQFMADDQPLDTDSTPASVENFKVNNLGYSTAQIFWNTDYRATCVVEYGTEPGNYTNTEVLTYDDTTDYYHTYHAKTLVDLSPDTQYYYKVTATDENSNVTVAEYDPNDSNKKDMTFKTAVAPEGSSDLLPDKPIVTNTIPYLNQVRINWTGNVATDEGYEIYYDTTDHGKDYNLYANKLTGIDARANKQVIKDLKNNTTYYFLLVATNDNGKTAADVISAIPTGVLIDFDFTKMTEAEKKDFIVNQYMYVLGGSVTMEDDPDTGENCLQLLDETNSHGVNSDLKLAVTQDSKFTYEVKMKIVYQKQTDALNNQKNVVGDASGEHNSLQLNFYKDALMTEDKDSTNSALWDAAFTVYFDSESSPISESNGRYDGTTERGTIKFGSTEVGSYVSGTTPGSDNASNRVLPNGTGYSLSKYKNTTKYGDALYSNIADTDKTLHGIWYYEKGSTEYVTYKIVVDPVGNNVSMYADDKEVYKLGEFSEDLEEPYNVGKVQIKSRNDGYSWVNIASIKAYSGDGASEVPIKPVPDTTVGGTGGGGGGNSSTPTSTPAPTVDPNATATPTTEPVATQNPNATKYFDDLGNVDWAVDAINALSELNIINGTSERVYSPNANVTRSEYVAMLMRWFGKNTTGTEVNFSDVSSTDWYYEPISKAVALGVAKGYDNGTFGVNENISREDMMVMAYRTMGAVGITVPKLKEFENFADQSSISDYAAEAVNAMYCAGVISGVGNNMLDPKGFADRAQAAKITYGLINMEGTVNE